MTDYADRLEQEYDKVVAERDQLQAVVNADPLWKPVLVLLANIDAAPQGSDVFELSVSPAVTAMREALRQRRELLDASPTREDGGLMGDSRAVAEHIDRLEQKLKEARDERDRLRAVVDAARATIAGIDFEHPTGVMEPVAINRLADLAAAVRRLDASPTGENT